METIHAHCDFCNKEIYTNETYGTLVYNIENLEKNAEYPNGIIEVHSSEQVHIMCLKCGNKYNRENVEEDINQIANQGFKEIIPQYELKKQD